MGKGGNGTGKCAGSGQGARGNFSGENYAALSHRWLASVSRTTSS